MLYCIYQAHLQLRSQKLTRENQYSSINLIIFPPIYQPLISREDFSVYIAKVEITYQEVNKAPSLDLLSAACISLLQLWFPYQTLLLELQLIPPMLLKVSMPFPSFARPVIEKTITHSF